ncbi:hypothetical protein M9H77_18460 [Catharanthus roseus]|uniref:Uncharacterized protein n=1 Tax=Catharanthus roseus TaxID=4058 RepID=A0ACC0B7K5_CATRO|nr:hypothetical protein M9H77_18460 [Catharanthus roseus]
MRFYTKNKKCFDQNLYSERRFEEIFTHGEVLKRHDNRTVNKLDAYGRLLHHMISNIIIPNVGHKSSITNMHSFVMLALHEHRRMNFGFIAIEHMLATQSSFTKCLPYGCFITKTFQHFMINLVGVGDQIGPGKIYNQNIFKRMGFERNDDGLLIRGGQQGSDDDDDEEHNGDEEEGNETERYSTRNEIKKRQERTEEGQSSVDTDLILDRIAVMQAQVNDRLDDLNDKIVDIQNRVMRLDEGEKIKPLKTLKTCVFVRDVLRYFFDDRNLEIPRCLAAKMVFERTNFFKGNYTNSSRRSSIKEHTYPSTFLTKNFPTNKSRKLGIMPHIGVQEGNESTTKEIISRTSCQHLRSKQEFSSLASLVNIHSEESHEKINN